MLCVDTDPGVSLRYTPGFGGTRFAGLGRTDFLVLGPSIFQQLINGASIARLEEWRHLK